MKLRQAGATPIAHANRLMDATLKNSLKGEIGMSENLKNFNPEKMIRTLLQLDAREKGLTVEVTVKAKENKEEGARH